MAHKLLSYRESTYLVATFKKSSNIVPTSKVRTLVPTLYVTVPTFVVRTRKVRTISSYFLKYVVKVVLTPLYVNRYRLFKS
jgi:hypothetical protein